MGIGFMAMAGFMIIICTIVTVSAYRLLPAWIMRICQKWPLLAFMFNMAISQVIAYFAGTGVISGVGNLTASVLFAVAVAYNWFGINVKKKSIT